MEQLFTGGGALQVPFGADFFSVAVGVLTGAIFACDRKLDIVGTIVLGLVTAYGGGIIRDLLLQDHGVYFMEYPEVILICICLAVFVFYFRGLFRHTGQVLFFADALSVALFALAGANKAFACGEGFVMVVILGALTSVGGGALRDISVGETPGVFQRSNFYAVAGFGGAFVVRGHGFREGAARAGRPRPACSPWCFCATCRCTTIGRPPTRPTSRRRWPVARERPSTSAPSCFAAPPCIARRSPPPAPRGFAIERISLCNRAFSSCTPGAPSA